MSFRRQRAQLRCESFLNCNTLEEWNQANFRSFQLNNAQATLLSNDLREDSKDLYFKGVLSLFEAVKSIEARLFSWATVKAYYSTFYFLKAHMAANGIALIRNKSLFYLKAINGETPISRGHKKYNTDHSGTINYFVELFTSDILLSQPIEMTNAYDWLMIKREQVHYRERTFNDPLYSDFWATIASQLDQQKLSDIIRKYVQDSYILCFQEEHAILAIPIKRALLTKEKLDNERIELNLNPEQIDLLNNLLANSSKEMLQLLGSN